MVIYLSVQSLSRVRLFATPWTVAHQAPLSMGFPRQEYWSGFPFPSPGHLPDTGIELGSSALEADSLPSEPPEKPVRILEWVAISSSRGSPQPREPYVRLKKKKRHIYSRKKHTKIQKTENPILTFFLKICGEIFLLGLSEWPFYAIVTYFMV